MNDIMNEIYYMLIERIGQQCIKDESVKVLLIRKCALMDEIILRLGKDGEKLMDDLAALSSEINDLQDKALFQTALCLGTKIALN